MTASPDALRALAILLQRSLVQQELHKGSPIESHNAYPPVSTGEIAFAIAIFVNAANRSISLVTSSLSPRSLRACDQAFLNLVPRRSAQVQNGTSHEASLYEAFKVLWEQFEGDTHQTAVCARILAFHFLMERTSGSVVAEWLKEHPETPETVVLDDAIVSAIAGVSLALDGSLLESEFHDAVRRRAHEREKPEQLAAIGDTRGITARLFALEAQKADADLAVASLICKELSRFLMAVVGRSAYRILLARAIALGTQEEPSLAAVRVLEDGTLEGADRVSAQAGRVLIGRFIDLQTTFVGETLLYNLLRELWPGLSIAGMRTGGVNTATSAR